MVEQQVQARLSSIYHQLEFTKRMLWLAVSQLQDKQLHIRDELDQIPELWHMNITPHPDEKGLTMEAQVSPEPDPERLRQLTEHLLQDRTAVFMEATRKFGLEIYPPHYIANLLKPTVHWDGAQWIETKMLEERLKQENN